MPERASRHSARVVLVDEDGCALLFRIVDALDTKPPVWITPGGGIEPGEDLATAAARELGEETGLVVAPQELGSPVAVARGDWEYRGTPLYSEDWYFGWRCRRFEPAVTGLTELEREVHERWRWWTPDELDRPDEPVIPAGLADVARQVALGHAVAAPVELPWMMV